MIIALTVYEDRISSVFDFSGELLIAEYDATAFTTIKRIAVNPHNALEKVTILIREKTDTLICGMISRCLLEHINNANIRIIPYTEGVIDNVLQAFAEGTITGDSFRIPGHCHRKQRGKRHGRRCR